MHATDLDLTERDVAGLTSANAVAVLLERLGYDISRRTVLTTEAVGLAGDSAAPFRHIELLSEDEDGFLRIVFAQLRSLTARARNDLVRVLRKGTADHVLVLAADFEELEFVLLDKRIKQKEGPAGGQIVEVVPRTISLSRRSPTRLDLRILRRFTWTYPDGLAQFDKLKSVFDAALSSEEFFQNRGLFADYFLRERLRDDPAWKEDPTAAFAHVRDLYDGAQARWNGKEKERLRKELFRPLFERLGFRPLIHRPSKTRQTQPDYLLRDAQDKVLTAAFVYPWDRWLDGPDLKDDDTPDENPGACVVTALDEGLADWIVVTNGRLWRIYGKHAHARSTNFYEVDLPEALASPGATDPNEAFRDFWLFFRAPAFATMDSAPEAGCWLDQVLTGCREYARRLGDRLKDRIFCSIFPHLARGFLAHRRDGLGIKIEPGEDDLVDVFEATLTLLYRLLFLLYAESRDLLPVRESAYLAVSLKRMKEEIARKAGLAESEVSARLEKAYSPRNADLYDRLTTLCRVMDEGDPARNVPTYHGGLFITKPLPPPVVGEGGSERADGREQRIARFLLEHKVPDRFLALAIDRLARDQDEKTLELAFIDYKSLEVRHLGSIYEGLLEFKLRVAVEDLTTQSDDRGEKYISLSQFRPRKGRQSADVVVGKGEVYLSNDRADRKASGSYYTPDPIVEYIVANAVGPVLEEKLAALRPEFKKVERTHAEERKKVEQFPPPAVRKGEADAGAWALEQTYLRHKELVERFFDLKVLDPAMGSGHFLVEAVDFITDRLLKFLAAEFPINPVMIALTRTRDSIRASLKEQSVEIDLDRLTDINLLKRHVLKRCIYGVDLNPMAVELAKVSLWLDAFTLGAPLSFLDHHLRCGNALVGATFAELKTEASGLFAIRYEPLLRAINHVLFVSRMADATAVEASDSARRYAEASKALSGYRVLFDCLAARHFGQGAAFETIIQGGHKLNLNSRERFLASLEDDEDRRLTAAVEELARRPDLRFFHWEAEFPEAFFGFADADERQVKHREELKKGSAGFDVVVGNPPYVRQETIKPLKDYLKASYRTYNSTNDLYVYFQEMEIRNLRAGGRMGMIVANKWMRAGYGEKLRDYLKSVGRPLEIVDFGHSPIFPDADTFPCILLATKRLEAPRKGAKEPEETMDACEVPRERWHERMDLQAFVGGRRHGIPTRLLRKEGWSLERREVLTLLEKIRTTGDSLKEFAKCTPLMGLKTGFNDAFVIDAAVRDRLVRENKTSEELFRPLLRGRDAARWQNRDSACFLITIPSSENKIWPWSDAREQAEDVFRRTYPAIYKHFQPHRAALIARQDQGRFYWELRSCDYMNEFDKPKIMWQEIQFHSWYCWDDQRSIVNNKVFFVPTNEVALLGVLNSPLMWWALTRILPHMKDEALSPAAFMMAGVNVALGSVMQSYKIRQSVLPLIEHAKVIHAWERETVADAARRFSLETADAKVVSWLSSPADTFAARLFKLAGIKKPAVKQNEDAASFQKRHRTRQFELLSRQLEMERRLASLVEDAYGLTAEERALLRDTRPVRDPLDVLEAKIRGGGASEEAEE